ncbi:glycosyltransferase family 2 protein [Candidatus Pacearchaeota archaeon]|nr:glycosyltransferase family 2 protein [Candidatus Pacearchaeota archaeon]
MKVLIIVPAYNEEKNVKSVIRKCLEYSKYVLAINDGSPDNTLKEIKKTKAICLNNLVNRGKGYSLRRGFKYAIKNKFDIVVTLDADGQHPPSYIPKFINKIEKGYDVVIGTRVKRHSDMPYIRRASNFLLSALFSAFSRTWIRDTQSGYRAIRISVLKGLKLESDRYEAESELLMKLGRRNVKFGRVIIPTIYGEEVSSINPFEDTFRFLKVVKYRK